MEMICWCVNSVLRHKNKMGLTNLQTRVHPGLGVYRCSDLQYVCKNIIDLMAQHFD